MQLKELNLVKHWYSIECLKQYCLNLTNNYLLDQLFNVITNLEEDITRLAIENILLKRRLGLLPEIPKGK